MIELRQMAAGLAALGAAFNREVTPQVAQVYHGVLGPKLDAQQWERAVRGALAGEQFFPPPAVLLRYGSATGAIAARAAEAFDAILSGYENGKHLSAGEVADRYGLAARDAFLAAGGRAVFDIIGGEGQDKARSFALRDFRDAWREVVEADPALALPSGNDGRELAAGDPSRNTAKDLMHVIAAKATTVRKEA